MNQPRETSKTSSFMKDQASSWAASALVGVLTAFVLGRVLNRKVAAFVTPFAVLVAHQKLDQTVAGQLRKAWK